MATSLKSSRASSSRSVRSALSKSSAHEEAEPEPPLIEIPPEELLPATDADVSESGKFRQLFGLLKKAIGVKDLAAARLSLPAHLCEPLGNLEYWMYAERPDFLAAMADGEDELERMMGVLRWTFTKDLKFVKHKIAKPYNSVLGEHFHCHYDIEPVSLHPTEGHPEPAVHLDSNPTPEVLSAAGRTSASRPTPTPSQPVTSSAASTSTARTSTSAPRSTSTAPTSLGPDCTRVVFLNEQTSHHPPISFFRLEARGPKGTVIAVGADQVSAKFTGASVKVFPGPHNKGIFVTLPEQGEEYQITHPTASVAGLLRGAPYATIMEHCYVTCRGGSGKKLRGMISYTEESWLLKPKFACEGIVYECEDDEDPEAYSKIKHVPVSKIVVTLEGCWRGEIRWKRVTEPTSRTLIDLVPLAVVPKTVSPLEEQHELETRKVWEAVTTALHAKEWAAASRAKQAVEQAQRDKVAERKKTGEAYRPAYFEPEGEEWDGRPVLTEEGRKAIEKEFSKASCAAV